MAGNEYGLLLECAGVLVTAFIGILGFSNKRQDQREKTRIALESARLTAVAKEREEISQRTKQNQEENAELFERLKGELERRDARIEVLEKHGTFIETRNAQLLNEREDAFRAARHTKRNHEMLKELLAFNKIDTSKWDLPD